MGSLLSLAELPPARFFFAYGLPRIGNGDVAQGEHLLERQPFLFLHEEQRRDRRQNQADDGHGLAIDFTLGKFGLLLRSSVRIPDAQRLVSAQDGLGVDGLGRRVGEEVDVAILFHLVNVSQRAFVFVAASQLSHRLLNGDVAQGEHLLEREVQQPGVHRGKEQRLPAHLILLDVIPEHVEVLAILRAPHIGLERFVRRYAEDAREGGFAFGMDYQDIGEALILNNRENREEYSVLILPAGDTISAAAAAKIKEFYDKGGKVIATGILPTRSAEFGKDKEVRQAR
jgi:hypothetical protein